MKLVRVISNLFRINRTNWTALALCLFTALIFWLFNSLNRNHTTNINFPIQFSFDTQRYVPVVLPKHVSMNISGNGWDLLRKSVGVRLPILIIQLDKPMDVKKIPGNTLLSLVSDQLGSIKINYVVGDTLDIDIDLKDSHKFRLVADLSNIIYKEGFGQISPIVILPDSVELEGPQSIIHYFPDTIVLVLSNNKLSDHYRDEVEVVVIDGELVKRNPPVVEVYFEVGEIVERNITVPVEIINKPLQLRIESLVDSVMCKITLPKKLGVEILKLNPAKAVINLKQTKKGEHIITPRIDGLPPLAHLVKVDSVYIRIN